MPITVLQLMARVGIDTKEAEAGMAALSQSGKAMSGGLVLGAGIATVAVLGIGAASVKMAGDFEAGTNTLVTGAGLAQNQLGMVRDGILQIARDTGTSTKQLIAGMFMISSAGKLSVPPLEILKAAAEGAKVGAADLGVTADALTTIMKDFPNTLGGATGAMNILIATVASGKTHMQDLASSLSGVLPTASSAGVGLNSVMAAMATMTSAGVPAANAATYLRQLIIALSAPSKQAADTLKAFGLTTKQVADTMHQSLPAALALIEEHVAKKFPVGSAGYIAAMKDIAGGSRQMQGILDLTGQHLGEFTGDFVSLGAKAKASGKDVTGWALTQGELNLQASRAKEVFETMMISLGEHLLPVATNFFAFLANDLIPTLQNFVSWVTGSSASATIFKGVMIAVAGAIMAVLVVAFVHWAVAAGAAAVATIAATLPILAIGAAIALVIAGVILAVTHWKQITTALGHFASMIVNNVKPALTLMGVGFQMLQKISAAVWADIKGGINGVIGAIDSFISGVDRIHVNLPGGNSIGFSIPLIPHLAEGGIVTGPTLALLGDNPSRREAVIPLPSGTGGYGGYGGSGGGHSSQVIQLHTQINVDGRKLAEVVTRHQPFVIRHATGTRVF